MRGHGLPERRDGEDAYGCGSVEKKRLSVVSFGRVEGMGCIASGEASTRGRCMVSSAT